VTLSVLADWGNFYVITGSAAAGLTGLTFVVIALASDAKRASEAGLRAYVTPTIVHFGVVLAASAFVTVPGQGAASLSVGFGTIGVGGLTYVGVIARQVRRASSAYVPFREDWLWHVALPAIAYAALLVTACLGWRRVDQSLYGIAAVSVALLFIGIHNAWDVAVWNSVRQQADPP
jgi:hypothetical protein